jgi:hypothetical protein
MARSTACDRRAAGFQDARGRLNIRPRIASSRSGVHLHKRFAAVAFARANHIDRSVFAGGPA